MYIEGQKVLGRGLSPVTRVLLGVISGLFGVVMILIAPEMAQPVGIYCFGGFCISISLMCITKGIVRNIIGRMIGLIAFGLSIIYFWDQFSTGDLLFGARGEPSLVNSILFFLAFGFPGMWFAITGRFPVRERMGE